MHVVLDMPAVVPHKCPGPASQKAVQIPPFAVLRQGFGHARRGATTGAGLDVQTTAELPQLQFSVEPVEIPRCSSRTRLCSCAQPVETPQAQFFSFWGPVHRYRAGGPCHEDRGRVAQTPGSSLPRCLASPNELHACGVTDEHCEPPPRKVQTGCRLFFFELPCRLRPSCGRRVPL